MKPWRNNIFHTMLDFDQFLSTCIKEHVSPRKIMTEMKIMEFYDLILIFRREASSLFYCMSTRQDLTLSLHFTSYVIDMKDYNIMMNTSTKSQSYFNNKSSYWLVVLEATLLTEALIQQNPLEQLSRTDVHINYSNEKRKRKHTLICHTII